MDLARAKQRLDVALTASSTGIWEISLPSGKIYLDDFSHSIFGLYPGTFDGRYASLMEHVDDADREAVDTALRVAMVRETDFSIEFGIHTSKGEKKYLNARGQVIYDADVTKRFTGTITDITEKKQLELETEQLKENQQQEIRAASLQAEENAKRSISESLHDSVGQILYAMRINLEQLKEQQGNPHYKQASRLLDQAVREVRDLSFELAPSILKDFGLMATLQEMSRRLSNDSLAVKVSGSDVSHLEMPMMVNIYRIVQELVNNSIKHGGASQVNIHISNKKDTIDIRVKDNGKGFSVNKVAQSPSGTGLSSIRNRINLYHGSMNIESAPGKGTNVFIQLKQ
jgi:PAS domain S-box-containing protein